jgi:hypothetical protein
MDERGVENHWETSHRVGKDDSKAQKLRELADEGDRV